MNSGYTLMRIIYDRVLIALTLLSVIVILSIVLGGCAELPKPTDFNKW